VLTKGKPEGRRSLERTRPRWEANIKIDLEKKNGVMYCIDLTQDWDRWRGFVNAVINLCVS
jgi:hypothetical protein